MDTPRYRIDWATEAGRLTALEPTSAEIATHAAELARGYNDPANAALMGHADELDADEVVESYAELIDHGGRAFLVFRDDELVGDADLRGLHGGDAEFAFMIGARSAQGKGLGTRVARMVYAFGFQILGLHHIYASLVPHNTGSRRVFEKLGCRLDDSPTAREFADEPGDIVMAIDRATFEGAHDLAQIRIATRG